MTRIMFAIFVLTMLTCCAPKADYRETELSEAAADIAAMLAEEKEKSNDPIVSRGYAHD